MRKICVATGSRAEYGLLNRLMKAIENDPDLQLQILATNMHLSSEFGLTYKEIESDGFRIDKKVEMLLSGDSSSSVAKSLGLGIIGYADALKELCPDLVVILGDRYEMLGVASTALLMNIPVAHIHGGELTEGAYDDAIRHSITKMAHLHFTSTEEYRRRVIQMGENPDRVFNVGALGVDNIRHMELMPEKDLEANLDIVFRKPMVLVTYHPVTTEHESARQQMVDLLRVLDEKKELNIVFTKPNSDTGGRIISDLIDDFVAEHQERAFAYTSLGHLRYLSLLQFVDAVVGNSSSGIIEVPTFGKATVNIGDRQKGRVQASSIVNCASDYSDIKQALEIVMNSSFSTQLENTVNPYEKEDTVCLILEQLKFQPLKGIIKKQFYNL